MKPAVGGKRTFHGGGDALFWLPDACRSWSSPSVGMIKDLWTQGQVPRNVLTTPLHSSTTCRSWSWGQVLCTQVDPEGAHPLLSGSHLRYGSATPLPSVHPRPSIYSYSICLLRPQGSPPLKTRPYHLTRLLRPAHHLTSASQAAPRRKSFQTKEHSNVSPPEVYSRELTVGTVDTDKWRS
jgi:hypothetical protein